jgi:hypothetical protein
MEEKALEALGCGGGGGFSSDRVDTEVVDLLATLKCTELQPYKWDNDLGKWKQGDYSLKAAASNSAMPSTAGGEGVSNANGGMEDVKKRKLVFVTYNVWFGTRRETKEELRPRFTALFKIVESKDADVVCFQEMTTNIIALLMEQEWIRQRYWITDTDEARTFLGYGVLMLSKLPYKHLK